MILKACDYDPDVPENDFNLFFWASGGKKRLVENQLGWLILDYEGDISPRDRIVKEGIEDLSRISFIYANKYDQYSFNRPRLNTPNNTALQWCVTYEFPPFQ